MNCRIFSAVFSNQFFHLKGTLSRTETQREFVRLRFKFEQYLVQHMNNKNVSAKFFFQNIFYLRTSFVRSLHILFNPFSKMFCNFSLRLNMANCRHVFFLALWVRKLRSKLNQRKAKFTLTCSFQKVIRTLAFRGREKFDNLFYFKIVGTV